MAINKARKAQVAWWASKVSEQAQEYADVFDPALTDKIRVAGKLDAIVKLCKEIQYELQPPQGEKE